MSISSLTEPQIEEALNKKYGRGFFGTLLDTPDSLTSFQQVIHSLINTPYEDEDQIIDFLKDWLEADEKEEKALSLLIISGFHHILALTVYDACLIAKKIEISSNSDAVREYLNFLKYNLCHNDALMVIWALYEKRMSKKNFDKFDHEVFLKCKMPKPLNDEFTENQKHRDALCIKVYAKNTLLEKKKVLEDNLKTLVQASIDSDVDFLKAIGNSLENSPNTQERTINDLIEVFQPNSGRPRTGGGKAVSWYYRYWISRGLWLMRKDSFKFAPTNAKDEDLKKLNEKKGFVSSKNPIFYYQESEINHLKEQEFLIPFKEIDDKNSLTLLNRKTWEELID